MAEAVVAILKATDVAATVGWYREAGFEVRRQEPMSCEVARDGLALQFLSGDTPWSGPPRVTGCFYVHVLDVDVVAEELRGRVDAPWGVEDRDWGSRELVLRDPDGYFITFTARLGGRSACWCCAGEHAEAGLVRLGAHPEVAVCLDCAHHLRRRAVARQDEHRRTPLVLVRAGVERVRGRVIAHAWHERGRLGAFLRRLDRYLP